MHEPSTPHADENAPGNLDLAGALAYGFWRAIGYEPDDRVDRWVHAFR